MNTNITVVSMVFLGEYVKVTISEPQPGEMHRIWGNEVLLAMKGSYDAIRINVLDKRYDGLYGFLNHGSDGQARRNNGREVDYIFEGRV